MTISVFASFYPHPESTEAFLELINGMVSSSRKEPGCLQYDLFATVGQTPSYHLYEIYADNDAVLAHQATDHYLAYRTAAPNLLAEPIGLLVLEPIDALD